MSRPLTTLLLTTSLIVAAPVMASGALADGAGTVSASEAPSASAAFQSYSPESQATLFAAALAAARQQQWQTLARHQTMLGEQFILQDYLDYHRLGARLDSAPVEEVMAWLRRYQESPLADDMRRQALAFYGRKADAAAVRIISNGVPADIALRCHYYRAMRNDEPQRVLTEAKQLWLNGNSLPDACDPLLAALKKSGQLDDGLIWQRLLLAAQANNEGLMRYLRSLLDTRAMQQRADHLLRLQQRPARVRDLMPADGHRAMAVIALSQLADKDPLLARRYLPVMNKRFDFSDRQYQKVAGRIAWFSTIRAIPENRAWLDRYLLEHGSAELIEQRLRRAISEQHWDDVLTWTAQLNSDSARWHYWQARAFSKKQQPDKAAAHLQTAATERNFWGFLAAEQLGQTVALNETPPSPLHVPLDERSERVVARAALLMAAGEAGHARSEWLHLLRYLGDDGQLSTLAQIAKQRGWLHLAIETALYGGRHDVLEWRFPLAISKAFQLNAGEHQLDPWLLMAIARRESAFNPQARSAVGARGLMQLMPATARQLADQAGMSLTADSLFDADTNIALGSRYLNQLLQRYAGNRILALAAYNAGPHRVDRWLDQQPTPFDVFIESIPFYETREYVQAVLAYRVIFSRHQDGVPLLAMLSEQEKLQPYTPMQLAANP
mgnify:CR=1 FL=1